MILPDSGKKSKVYKFIVTLKSHLVVLLFLPFWLNAQMVQNASYNVMLKALLSHDVKEVSAKDAKMDTAAVFIDAREKREYDISHIKGALWSGYDDFEISRLKTVQKGKPIIVYCSVGYRSEKITAKLTAAGYKNVKNMVGGIFEWKNVGYKVYDLKGYETEKVHAYSKTWGIWLNKGEKVYN